MIAKIRIGGTFVAEMALLLYIDTSGARALAMLANGGEIISSKTSDEEREHAAHINGLIGLVLAEAGVAFKDLEAVCVCNGPGSYTGLRIGLSTAKGLCLALSIPLITNNKLELILASSYVDEFDAKNWLAVIPARIGEYFIAARGEEYVINPSHLPVLELEKLVKNAPKDLVVTGIIPIEFQEFLNTNNIPFKERPLFDIAVWAQLGNTCFLENNFANLAYCEPEYLKSTYISARSDDKKG